MMNWNKYKFFYIICIQFVLVLAGHVFAGSESLASSMWPAIGFSVIFFLFDKKSLLPIFIGTALGQLFNQFVLIENPALTAIGFAIYFSTVSILEVILFKVIFTALKRKLTFKYSELLILVLSYIFSAIVGGIIVGITFYIIYQSPFLEIGSRWAIGDLFGMTIFSTILYYIYTIDKKINPLRVRSALLIAFYILFSLLMFLGDPSSNIYLHFVILFIPIYVYAAVYFQFSIFILLNMLHIVLFQIFYVHQINVDELGEVLVSINIVLLVLTFVSVFLKLILIETENQKRLVIEKNNKLNKVMSSIHKFFNLSSGFSTSIESFDENYMKSIFTLAKEMFGTFDGGSCYIVEEDHIKFIYAEGLNIEVLNELKFKKTEFSFEIDKPILHKISNEDITRLVGEQKLQKYLDATPIIMESVYMGFYLSEGKQGGVSFDILQGNDYRYTPQDLELFESFQKTMNDLYKSSILVEENQLMKNSVVMGLVRAINLYDNYTKGHCEDVAYVAKEIAVRMIFSPKQVGLIEIAGLLHDVGKLGIPRHILNKPARLTDEEYEIIKKHPQLGADILHDLPDMKEISTYIMHHHERWDGKGYPAKLREDETPIGAQILGVCDAACSMLEGRVYAAKKNVKEVIDELERFKGTQFSPVPTDILIKMLHNPKIVKKILAFYQEP